MEMVMDNDLTQHRALPGGWSFDSIGNLFDIRQGKSLARHRQTGKQKKKFLRTANVLWGKLDLSELDEMDFSPAECEALALKLGDLLVCEGGDIGRTAVWRGESTDCYYQNHLHRLRAKDGRVNPHFVMFWMQAAITQLRVYEGFGNKTTIPNLSRSRLSEFMIPVPEESEQEKIAAVLWKIQKAVEIEDAIVRNARDLKKSLLRRLFTHGLRGEPLKETEIGPLPQTWEVVPLGDIAQIGNGSTPKRDNTAYWQRGTIPWLTSAKIYDRVIEHADEFVTDVAVRECHLPRVKPGSLLIAITGQGKTLGNAAISAIETTISQHLAFAQFKRIDVEPNFIRFFVDGQYDLLRQVASGGGSTKGALTCGFLKSFPVPLATAEEQREIADILQTVDRKIDIHESKKRSLQDLFKTTLHKLMTAQIRVKDLDIDTSEVGVVEQEGKPG